MVSFWLRGLAGFWGATAVEGMKEEEEEGTKSDGRKGQEGKLVMSLP